MKLMFSTGLMPSYPNFAVIYTKAPYGWLIVVAVSAINLLMLVYASILMWDKIERG